MASEITADQAMEQAKMTVLDELPAAITRIRCRREKSFIKRREIAELVYKAFCTVGFFCRSEIDILYFFDGRDRLLYALASKSFASLLANTTGLNQTEAEFNFVRAHFRSSTYSLTQDIYEDDYPAGPIAGQPRPVHPKYSTDDDDDDDGLQ